MARRRLAFPDAALPRISPGPASAEDGERARPRRAAAPLAAPPPIARVAGENARDAAAEIARLKAEAEALQQARAEGRVLMDVALAVIETGYLDRDRIERAEEDEAAQALKASIARDGQRTPIELIELPEGRFGLISGWRRLRALSSLRAETGDPRWGVARALVRPEGALGEEGLAAAFRAMVEENEIRADLSHYERGRICALAAKGGAYADEEAALQGLFGAVSAPRRSKIRSFLTIYRTLGSLLAWPEAIPERLGLDVAKAIKWGGAAALRAALEDGLGDRSGPEEELEALRRGIAAAGQGGGAASAETAEGAAKTGRGSGRTGSRRAPDPSRARKTVLPSGLTLEQRRFEGHADLRISGEGLDDATLARAYAALEAALQG